MIFDYKGRPANWAWAEDGESQHWHPVATREQALANARLALTSGVIEAPNGIWVARCREATLEDVVDWQGDLELGEAVVDDATIVHLANFVG